MIPPLNRRKREEPEDEGWLITFADMSVLLMCFFVLLFAMSSPNTADFKVVAEALRVKGFYNDAIPTEDPYKKIKKQLSMSLGASGFDRYVVASDTALGIDVEISSAAFFQPGSAEFLPEAKPILQQISDQILPLAKLEVTVEVEGHTDSSPVSSKQFPSNWELSSARASSVVRFLVEQGFPKEKLKAIGRADTDPKVDERDPTGLFLPGNQDLNRRVVVHLIKGLDQ